MVNLVQIAQSWYEFSKGNQDTKELMEQRLKICDRCPFKEQLGPLGKKIVTSLNQTASTYYCDKCKCPLAAKVSHPSNKCPMGKWGLAGS